MDMSDDNADRLSLIYYPGDCQDFNKKEEQNMMEKVEAISIDFLENST